MTAGYPPHPQEQSPRCTVHPHRLERVGRASRLEAAVPSEQRRDRSPVELDDPCRDTGGGAHRFTPARPRARSSSTLHSWKVFPIASGPALTMASARRNPASDRHASRSRRFNALRSTAPLPGARIDSPNLPSDLPPDGATQTRRSSLRPPVPEARTRSKSLAAVRESLDRITADRLV
jgi:hypothetical protein